MAIIQFHYRSGAVWRTVPVEVILPIEHWENKQITLKQKKFKTLYLLHGLHGQCTDWMSYSRIRRWAEQNDLAVVMPSGDNSFYTDRPDAKANYGDFLGRELVEVTRAMFPLSDKREDTFIGGLSMGGYGALRTGLKYHETFGAIIALSAAFAQFETSEISFREYRETCFGPLEEAAKTDKNPRVLMERLKNNLLKPKVYIACGLQDALLPWNRLYHDLLKEHDFDVVYEEWEGDHDWEFWDAGIEKAISWLPLENNL